MSQATTWAVPSTGPATPTVMAARMNAALDALLSAHGGATAPAYKQSGTSWLDTSVATAWVLRLYDGANWLDFLVINPTTHAMTIAGALLPATTPEATAAEFRANTPDRVLTTDQVWSSAAYVALTDAATIAVNLNLGINFAVTLAGNRTLGFPTNLKPNQSGTIKVKQDATGGRTLAFAAGWKFTLGTVPAIQTTAAAKNYLDYQVDDDGTVWLGLRKDVK